MERQEALFRWVVRGVATELPREVAWRVARCDGRELPEKVRRGGRRAAARYLLDMARSPYRRGRLRMAVMREYRRLEEAVGLEEGAVGAALRGMEEPGRRWSSWLRAEWAFTEVGRADVFRRALEARFEPADVEAYEGVVGMVQRDMEAEDRESRSAAEADAAARLGLERARRTEAAAKAQAARALADLRRVEDEAGRRVAEALGEVAELRREVAELRAALRERDEQTARLMAEYERRLAESRVARRVPVPLEGRRVLVVADPNRAVGYEAEARALGAERVEFLDGRAVSGEHARGAARAADVIVINVAWVTHSLHDVVVRAACPGAVVVRMRTPGLTAFRRAVVASLAGQEAAGGEGA